MEFKHLDQARREAIEALSDVATRDVDRALLVEDLFGQFRLVLWSDDASYSDRLAARLATAAGPYWSGDVWVASKASEPDRLAYEEAWETAPIIIRPNVRVGERLRNRDAWVRPVGDPPWTTRGSGTPKGPPIIAFYSFKGGMGRSTSLASFAIQRARRDERVVVIDFDLDAPGVGNLLAADSDGTTAGWGVIDYLLEAPHDPPLRDYYHACRRERVTGPGEILVVPAGIVDDLYLGKLARIDLEMEGRDHPFSKLLRQTAEELAPDWILVDGRTGLAESAGVLLSGLAHLHVLFGTESAQSWQGLASVISRLGAHRVLHDRPQAECMLVQAMVPAESQVAALARKRFSARAEQEFTTRYYVENPDDPSDESYWYVRDGEADDAPHVPIALSYDPRLSFFGDIEDVAETLAAGPEYLALGGKIAGRFVETAE